MKFNIQPQDLMQMITRLRGFAQGLDGIAGSMKNYAGQLQGTWQDPQYLGFVTSVDQMSRQLKLSEENLIQMAKQLEVLKQNLERAHSDYSRMNIK